MKNAVVFSGQGAQYPGMFVDLIEGYDLARDLFAKASDIVNIDLINLCKNGSAEELSLTENLQPLVLTCDIVAWELLKDKGIKADYFAGYSLGEYAALYASGFLSFEDVLQLIVVRANAMQEAVPVGQGGMAAVLFSDANVVEDYFKDLDKQVWISNKNTNGQYTIAGLVGDLSEACDALKELGVTAKQVPVSAPFHCALLKPAAEKIKAKLDTVSVNEVSTPVILNYDGEIETDISKIKEKMYYQAYCTVQWIKTMQNLYDNDVRNFIECGPGKTLTGFTKRMRFDGVKMHRVEDEKTLDAAFSALQ